MPNYSKQCNLILQILKQDKSHPTAAEVYKKVKREIPNISLGTVYRNLAKLAQSGDILSLSFSDGSEHFDGNISAHLHLHCTKCGKTVDTPVDDIGVSCTAIENGFTPERSVFTVYGICNECKNEGRKKK